jgi:hypothetical protein
MPVLNDDGECQTRVCMPHWRGLSVKFRQRLVVERGYLISAGAEAQGQYSPMNASFQLLKTMVD